MSDGKRRYGRSRRDLAEAAIRQIEQKGYAATTVEDVAEAAGYSPRTFFRQFATKEDVVFFDFPDILSPLQQLLREPPASAWDAVTEVMLANSASFESAGSDLAVHRTRLIHSEPALHRRYLELSAEWEVVIAEIFAAERSRDVAQDTYAQVVASSIVGAAQVALRRWLADPATGLGAHLAAGLTIVEAGARPRR